jgi:hypothetical protein
VPSGYCSSNVQIADPQILLVSSPASRRTRYLQSRPRIVASRILTSGSRPASTLICKRNQRCCNSSLGVNGSTESQVASEWWLSRECLEHRGKRHEYGLGRPANAQGWTAVLRKQQSPFLPLRQ